MANTYTNLSQFEPKLVWDHLGCQMLFNAIFCYLFLGSLKGLWGQFCEPKLPPIDLTMEEGFVKHYPRNISAFGKDEIWANRPEVQCIMPDFQNGRIWHTVALVCLLRSHPPQRPEYSLGHAWQKLLPWWGQLEGVWAHIIDPKVPLTNLEKVPENSIK